MASSSSAVDIAIVSSPDGPIITYDVSSGTILARFTGSRSPRNGVTLAGNAYLAASHISPTSVSASIHLYNWWSHSPLHHLSVPELVAPLSATPDGLYLFAGGISGRIYVLSLPSGNIIRSVIAHRKAVTCLEISKDESLLISGGDDGRIVKSSIFQLIDSSGDHESNSLKLHDFFAHDDSVTAIKCSGLCNSMIVSCSFDCTCKFWELLNGTPLGKVAFGCATLGVALDPLETYFFAAGSDGFIYKGSMNAESEKLDNRGYRLVALGQNHYGPVVSVVMVNEGRNLVSASEDGRVWLSHVDTGDVIMVLGKEMGDISNLLVSRVNTNVNFNQACASTSSDESATWSSTSSSIEQALPAMEAMELGNVLAGLENDKSKAIDMLESAIASYEKLLEMILKEATEATGRTRKSSENANDDK